MALQQIRQELGLDQPLIVQYGTWLWGAARLDFGNSYWTRQPVIEELKRRYPLTANLAVLSLLLGTLIAIPIGVLSAVRQDTLIDYAARVFVIAGLSLPISGCRCSLSWGWSITFNGCRPWIMHRSG